MIDNTLLDQTIAEALGLSLDEIRHASYGATATWDSVAHLTLMASIEERFGISLGAEDVSAMSDYDAIMRILDERYGLRSGV